MKITIIKNYILITSMFLSSLTYGQSVISGKVVDSLNNPIEFANIAILESIDNSTRSGTVSNENGFFSLTINNNKKIKILVSFIGYGNFEKDLNISESTNIGNIVLFESANSLNEFVITSTKEFITKKEDKIVLNIQDSPLKVGYDVIEVLQRSPYVWVDANNNVLMKNEAATILINGRKTNLSSSELSDYLTGINSENVKNIEITTNKGANIGGASTGGVIDIILLKKPLGFNSTVKSIYTHRDKGFYRNYQGGVFNYGAKKWNIYGNYNFSKNVSKRKENSTIFYNKTQNFIQTQRVSESNTPKHNYRLGGVSEVWPNHEFGLELFGSISSGLSDVPGGLTITNGDSTIDQGTLGVTNEIDNQVVNGVFNYKWKINKNKETLKLFIDYANKKTKNSNVNLSNYDVGMFNNSHETNDFNASTRVYSFQSDYKKTNDNGLKVETGIKYTYTSRFNNLLSKFLVNDSFVTDTNRTTSFKYKEAISAGYFSLDKGFLSKHYFKLGLRVENTDIDRFDLLDENSLIERNYTNFFPSAYYSYDISNKKSLSVSYSRSVRRPSFNFLNNNITKINDFRFSIGSPYLQPEVIDKYEIRYLFNQQIVSFYYNQANDAINGVYFLIDDVAFYQRKNAGSQVQYGLQYNRSDKINNWMFIRLSGNFFYRKFVDEEGVDRFDKYTVYLNVFGNFKFTKTLALDVVGRFNTAVADAFYEAAGKHSINLILKKSFLNKKLNARIYIRDIFNSLEYSNVREFDTYVTRSSDKPQTRTIGLWLTYNFTNNIKVSTKKNKSNNSVKNRL